MFTNRLKNGTVLFLLFLSSSFLLTSCEFVRKLTKPKSHASTPHHVKKPVEPETRPDKPSTNTSISSTDAMFRINVIDYAKSFIGTKYKYTGTEPKKGFDCSGFTSYVLKNFDITVSHASRVQCTEGKEIPLSVAKPGDLVFFSKYGKGGKVTHVAMVVENTSEGIIVVHSTTSRGVITENITTSDYWKPKTLYARDVISR